MQVQQVVVVGAGQTSADHHEENGTKNIEFTTLLEGQPYSTSTSLEYQDVTLSHISLYALLSSYMIGILVQK